MNLECHLRLQLIQNPQLQSGKGIASSRFALAWTRWHLWLRRWLTVWVHGPTCYGDTRLIHLNHWKVSLRDYVLGFSRFLMLSSEFLNTSGRYSYRLKIWFLSKPKGMEFFDKWILSRIPYNQHGWIQICQKSY